MAERIGWDQFETALLIDACEKTNSGYANKQKLIMELSCKLRKRAISQGRTIDEVFRNVNGIALQMMKMNYLLTNGAEELPGASKFYSEMVRVKRENPISFNKVLAEAQKQIEFSPDTPTGKLLIKKYVDKSLLKEGLTIPKDAVSELCNSLGVSLNKGEKCNISIVVDDDIYDAKFTNVNFSEKYANAVTFQIRYSAGSSICKKLNDVFSHTRALIASEEKFQQCEYIEIYSRENNQIEFVCHPVKNNIEKAEMNNMENAKPGFTEWLNGQPKLKSLPNSIVATLDEGSEYTVLENFTDSASRSGTVIDDKSDNLTNIAISKYKNWMVNVEKMPSTSARTYTSTLRTAVQYSVADRNPLLVSDSELIGCIMTIFDNPEFASYNSKRHNSLSVSLKKYAEFRLGEENLPDSLNHRKEVSFHAQQDLYNKLYAISKVYDEPQGLTIERILDLLDSLTSRDEVIECLNKMEGATKISDSVYSFSKHPIVPQSKLDDYDKGKYVKVLLSRFGGGLQFDSIDLEIFRDTYNDLFEEKINFSDEELILWLKHCGIIYEKRLFAAEGIIDNNTKEKLFSYIESNFSSGKKVLYYGSIYKDMEQLFAYCYSLTGVPMLRAFIEFTSPEGKYYFFDSYMSTEKNVKIDHATEIADFMLTAGKPVPDAEVFAGLSHITDDIIYHEIRFNSCYQRNEKGCYFHVGIFELDDDDTDRITELINKEIEDNGYAIWSRVFLDIQEQMPLFLENNLYLSSLGIRNALSIRMNGRFNFSGEVISMPGESLSMADVYRIYAKRNAPFTDDDIYAFSKEIGTAIYFEAVAEETVRVNRRLFVPKDQISFDIEAADKALETYLSSGYILVKDVNSFLVFPNEGFEWNSFLLESYLNNYSRKFTLVNNGSSLNNVAGAVVKTGGEYSEFVDICAHALDESGVELKKTSALNYLAEINLITRRSYSELDVALTKARQIRNRKE